MWDQRFAGYDYIFGTAPSRFLTQHAGLLVSGQSALAVADGEGRNGVFLAEHGLAVTSMDSSPNAQKKAARLAAERGVALDLRLAEIESWDWDAEAFDLVVGIFIQFMGPELRQKIFAGMKRAVAPGGLVLLHGYRPKQIEYGTGGPRAVENLYTQAILETAFSDFEIAELATYEANLDEGVGHSGRSALIDLVARRPE